MNAQSDTPSASTSMPKCGFRLPFTMRTKLRCLSAVTALCCATMAQAADLKPIQAHSVKLGEVSGIVYYTAETDGFQVVATLGGGEDAPPVRFIATLAPEQAVVISVPRGVDQPAAEVKLVRHGNRLEVSELRLAAR